MASAMKSAAATRTCTGRREVASVSRPAPSAVALCAPVSARRQQAAFTAAPARMAVQTRATAAAPEVSKTAGAKTQYYALVASADFYFNDPQNESMAEQLRERVRFFKEQNNKELDFWIVAEPKWLDAKYPEKAKQIRRPAVALIGTDASWITFMKLRLDRVMRIDLGDMPASEALAKGGKVPKFSSSPKWTAPYPRYTDGWWEVFEPKF